MGVERSVMSLLINLRQLLKGLETLLRFRKTKIAIADPGLCKESFALVTGGFKQFESLRVKSQCRVKFWTVVQVVGGLGDLSRLKRQLALGCSRVLIIIYEVGCKLIPALLSFYAAFVVKYFELGGGLFAMAGSGEIVIFIKQLFDNKISLSLAAASDCKPG